jgi:arylamine N-acetyltransferase
MVNIMTIAGIKYLVDVGFSSFSPVKPVELLHDKAVIYNGSQQLIVCLEPEHIPDNTHRTNPEQLLWTYKMMSTEEPGESWMPGYCFSEVEFLPDDFEVMNFFVCQSPTSWFRWHVVALVFVCDDSGEDVIGTITIMGDEVKMRMYGESRVIKKLENEDDRVQALREFLRIELNEVQKRSILGTVSQLR